MSYFSLASFRISVVILFIFSLLCTQIPLFNYLGFEFSALTSVLASFLVGIVTLALWRNPNSQEKANVETFIDVSTRACLLLLVMPFAVMSLNGFFVKNCAYAEGASFFLLMSVPAVLFANAIAFFIATNFNSWNKTLFAALFVMVLLHIPVVTFTGVQIFAFNPIMGFFPGFTYDETMNVVTRLLAYRVQTLATVVLIWMITVWFQKKKITKKPWSDIISQRQRWAAILLVCVVATFTWFSDEMGFSSSKSYVRNRLGAEIETEHFVIWFPSELKHSRARDLAMLHEFYFDRISKELRVNTTRKIHSFVYLSSEQKARLVGAGRTNISKPWLWQLHVNLEDVEASLKHELVHVMAADFGFPLLRIGPNSGFIEGLAVAVEGTNYETVVHRTAAEIFAVGVRPDMESMFSWSGFLRAHPGVSYTLAGSFCRYLIDRYGLRRFKRVYGTGNFQAHYNRNLDRLISDWKAHLATIEIRDSEKERAAYLFIRPSIFGKECARVVANLNAQTRSLYGRKKYLEALASSNQSLEESTSIEAILQKTNSLLRMKLYNEAIDFAETKLKDTTVAHALLPLRLALGDAYWALGSKGRALEAYQRLLSVHVSLSLDEACATRLQAAFSDQDRLKPYFTREMTDSDRIEFLSNTSNQKKNDTVVRYLLGRELMSNERYREAIEALLRIKKMDLGVLEFLRQRRIGSLYFNLGEFQKAKIHFWQALNDISNEAYFIEMDEWLKRCDWMEEHATKPNL